MISNRNSARPSYDRSCCSVARDLAVEDSKSRADIQISSADSGVLFCGSSLRPLRISVSSALTTILKRRGRRKRTQRTRRRSAKEDTTAPISTSAFSYNLRRCMSPAEERRINFGPPPLMLDLQELPLNFPRMVMGNSVTMLPARVSASMSKALA